MLIGLNLHAQAVGRDREKNRIALNNFDYSNDPITRPSLGEIGPGRN